METSGRGILRRTGVVLLPTGGIVVGGVFGWTGLGIALGLSGAASVIVGAVKLYSKGREGDRSAGAENEREEPGVSNIVFDQRRATAWVLVGSALEFVALILILLAR